MKRDKVVFDFVASKPIEDTDDLEEISPEPRSPPGRMFSSMLYKEALKCGVLKSPVIRYWFKM